MEYRTIPWSDDVEAAAWVVEGLRERSATVAAMVPVGYAAYAWADLGWHRQEYQAAPLIDLLRRESPAAGADADRCLFALADLHGWTGQGPDPGSGITLTADEQVRSRTDFDAFFNRLLDDMQAGRRPKPPRAHQPPYPHRMLTTSMRGYMLYRGPVEDAVAPGAAGGPRDVPDLWWSEDRVWFVGGDTDVRGAYVGGPEPLIAALLAAPGLEAVRVDVTDALAPHAT